MAKPSQTSTTGSPTWSAERPETADPRKHRWQGVGEKVRRSKAFRPRRRRPKVFILFCVLLGLFALFVYNLIFAPVKTPLVIIAATEYAAPIPPADWTQEDLDGLKELDDKTFRVVDTSASWNTKAGGLAELDRRLKEVAGRRGNDGAAIFYVALHGAVDGEGRPCLLLPAASPWMSSEWLPVDELFDHLTESLPEDVQKVVVLDSCRILSDWNLGTVRNTFVERVQQLIERRNRSDLHVLTSAGPGERSWASAEVRGSPFGRAVKMALAGDADRSESARKFGNRNGRVSAQELHRYVATKSNDWALANRGVAQTPQWISATAVERSDFRIAWTLSRGDLKRLREAEGAVTRAADVVAADDVARLWRQLESLRKLRLYQSHPLAWRELEHGLLRLEKTSAAGEAYRGQALRLQSDLHARLEDAAKRAAAVGDSQSPAARASILAPQEFESIDGARLHSTVAAETFGTLTASAAATLRERYLNPALRESATSGDANRRPAVAPISMESEWARMTNRYRTAERWKDAEVVRNGFGMLERAEYTAVGGDERSHYWVEPALTAAYTTVRADFDRTFVGPEESGEKPWSESRRVLDRLGPGAGTFRAEIDAAIAARDRGAAEGAYLAGWFCRADALPIDAERDVIERRLLPWIANLRQLGEAIDARAQTPGETLPSFVASSKTVAAELEGLKEIYLQAVEERIHRADADAATLRELQAALELPFLAAERRAALAQKIAAMAGQLHEASQQAGDSAAADAKTAETAPTADVAATSPSKAAPPFTSQSLRTLYEILELQAPAAPTTAQTEAATDRWTEVERGQTAVRNRLIELTTLPTTDESQLGERPRDVYSRTDRLLRSAAPLAFALPQIDAAARLRRFDLQQMLLWNCRRLLDDFWGGPTDGVTPATTDARPFFDLAVGDYLIVAEDLLFPAPSVRREIEDIRQVLSKRRVGARRGGIATVDSSPPEQIGDQVTVDVVVKPGLEASPAGGDEASEGWLPQGSGVVFARNAERPLPTSAGAWQVPPPIAGTRVQLTGEVPKSLGSSFEAVAMFRGNEFTAPFARPGLGGVVVDFQPTRPDAATITLFGDRPQQSSVMFILDCSASMAVEMPVELVDANRLPRLDLAKSALNALLEQLAVRADTRVGVRFFGHRVGWARGESARLMTQDEYSGPIPDDLAPSADVELVLPLGRFDTVEAGLVSSRLRTVKPWGQSPLYLSLLDSLRDFDADRDDTNRSIVVITDGANYQFTPADGGASAPAHQTLNDVLTAFQGKHVPIYILGFGLTGDDASTETARREFTTLAERTGGRFFVVENGRDLLQALRDQVSLGSYGVEASMLGASTLGAGAPASIKLNTPRVVNGLSGGPEDLTVRFQSSAARVTVEGGEALELFASRDGRITARPYDRQLPVQDVMSCDADPRRLVVRGHRPTPGPEGVKFPISVQDPEAPFTPRPDEMWIEITPVIDGRAEATPRYLFYDRKFDPNAPVPLSTWTATAWPSGAKQARIAPFYKYGRTEPFQTIPLAEVAERPTLYAGGVAVRSVSGVKLRVQLPEAGTVSDVYEIKVIEEHDARSAGVHSLKVMLETAPGSLPERIVRRFDADRGVVIHSFRFAPEVGRRVAADAASKVTLTSRSAALEGAFRIDGGRTLTVDLAGSGDLLPLDAATGVR